MGTLDPNVLSHLRRRAAAGTLTFTMRHCPQCDGLARMVDPRKFRFKLPKRTPGVHVRKVGRCCLDCGWLHMQVHIKVPPLRAMVLDADGHECVYCGAHTDLQIDHVFPRARGGTDAFENLVTACRSCNASKGTGEPAAMRFGRFTGQTST